MRAGLTIPLVSKAEIMDKLQAVQFDVRGTRAENRVLREKIPLKYKDCPWIVPNGSPYFAEGELVDLFNEAGGRLNLGTDYWFEGEFEPFCEATGRSICSFVKLSDKVLAENEFVSMTYQSIGAWFVPRNSIDEWVREIYIGKIPIPWSKVYNVPPTLPSSKHAHTIKTEIGDWYELTFFFTYLANYYSTRDPNVYVEADQVITESFTRLKQVKAQQLARLNNHDKDYGDPHQITKFHLQLGNHDNFDTATPEQDVAGTAANLLSTPEGVMRLSDKYTVENDAIMRNGVLPVSYFGNGGYIPPTILGSFEGLGSLSECMGICVEASGRVVVLQNHFDGRSEGLYFSILSDYKNPYDPKNPYRFEYTAYRYEPPVLTNNGVKPNHIIAGSGNDVIMVGKTTKGNPAATDRWFVALTNNSFDPSGHRFIETNMANVFAECGPPNSNGVWAGGFLYHGRMSVDLMGEWILLTVDAVPTSANDGTHGRIVRFRVPRKAIIDGTPATWQLLKVTYQDYDGNQYTNVNSWNYCKKQGTDSSMTKWGRYVYTTLKPPAYAGSFGRRLLALYAKKDNAPNIYHYNFLSWTWLNWTPPGQSYNDAASITNMVYDFNIETGEMVNTYKQPTVNVDYLNNNEGEVYAERAKWMVWYGPLVRYLYPATVITANGEVLSSITGNRQEASVLNSVLSFFKFSLKDGTPITSKAQFLSGSLGGDRLIQAVGHEKVRNIRTPIPIGLTSRQIAYEAQGENFLTSPTLIKDPTVGLQNPQVVCRDITGGYAQRPEVTNTELAPIFSRPLTNKVYPTNMSWLEGVVSISGPSSELDGRGVECGTMGMSACGWSSIAVPGYGDYTTFPSPAFRAPNPQGAILTFPKTYTRVLDIPLQLMQYTPTSFYGITAAVKDKIRALIPAAQQGPFWTFSLFVLNGETGGTFGGLNKVLLHVKYPTQAGAQGATWDGQVLLLNPVVEAPNAAHPGCHMITDFQIAGRAPTFIQHRRMVTARAGAMVDISNRPFLNVYRSGNALQCVLNAGFAVVGGTIYIDFTVFNVDVGTGGFSNVGGDQLGWEQGDGVVVIPRLGRTNFGVPTPNVYDAPITPFTDWGISNNTSGGAARFMPVGSNYYATITSYPETGWAVFFLEEVAVMVQGTLYRAPTGTVDLRDIDTDPRNKTFYVYITIEDTTAKYIFSTVKLRKGSAVMLVAVITTNEKQILTLERRTPFMVADYELSFVRDGGIIPISSGFPQDNGVFKFVKTSELLP